MSRLKPVIDPWSKLDIKNFDESATEYWLCNWGGDSYYLRRHGEGWVVIFQQSYLCKDGNFKHKDDIGASAIDYSRYTDPKDSDYVFADRVEATEFFKKSIRK